MKGKEKCRALKEIRRQIAEKNEIAYVVSECKHQGDCRGTCPKCESELRYLEAQLKIRQNLGKAVTIAGLCATMPALTACTFPTGTEIGESRENYPEDGVMPAEYEDGIDTPLELPESSEPESSDDTDITIEELMGDIAPSLD